MTVIAWDGKTLAADKRAGTDLPRTVTKIYRAKNGCLIGMTGNAHADMEMKAWYEDGADPAKFPAVHRDPDKSTYMMVITLDKKIQTYLNHPYPATFEDKYMAIGSGRDFAMTAMYLGHNAVGAVGITCDLCASCGNGIDTLELSDAV